MTVQALIIVFVAVLSSMLLAVPAPAIGMAVLLLGTWLSLVVDTLTYWRTK